MSGKNRIKLIPAKAEGFFIMEAPGLARIVISEPELEDLLFQYWAYKLDQHKEAEQHD